MRNLVTHIRVGISKYLLSNGLQVINLSLTNQKSEITRKIAKKQVERHPQCIVSAKNHLSYLIKVAFLNIFYSLTVDKFINYFENVGRKSFYIQPKKSQLLASCRFYPFCHFYLIYTFHWIKIWLIQGQRRRKSRANVTEAINIAENGTN